jgi:two-component system, OmpR family, response regulator ChvI
MAITPIDSEKKKRRILVVDDEDDAALTIRTILEESGSFKVDVFNDPKLVLSNFKEGRYDLLLIDILMPRMNGFELYEKIRQIDKNVKVCFITAYETYHRALQDLFPTVEVDCVIKKPVGKRELVNRIEEELTI